MDQPPQRALTLTKNLTSISTKSIVDKLETSAYLLTIVALTWPILLVAGGFAIMSATLHLWEKDKCR